MNGGHIVDYIAILIKCISILIMKVLVQYVIQSVLLSYLTPEGIGGPTLVTTQTLQSQTLAKNGWLIFPNENSLGVFDGKYLHGVIPGKGVTNVANRGSNKNGVDTSIITTTTHYINDSILGFN